MKDLITAIFNVFNCYFSYRPDYKTISQRQIVFFSTCILKEEQTGFNEQYRESRPRWKLERAGHNLEGRLLHRC